MLSARDLCIPALALPVLAILFTFTRTTVHKGFSTSTHIGRSKRTYLIFAVASTLSAICMAGFIWLWLVPELHLSVLFQVISVVVLLCFLGTAWARYEGEGEWDFHSVCAYGDATLIPVQLSFLLFTTIPYWAKVALSVGVAWMAFTLALLFVPNIKRWYLPFQLSYLGVYCAATLIIAYTS